MLTNMGLAEKEVTFTALQDWTWRVYRSVWNRISQYWTEERWIRVTDDERNMKWVTLNQRQIDPQTGQEVVQNKLAELDVDIILEDGPDSVNIQSEQYQQLVELKKADPSIPTMAVIEASQLRNKDKLIELMQQGGIPPQIQKQMQDMQQQLQDAQQKLQEAQQQAHEKGGDRELKAMELRIKEYEAVTARITALKPDPLPDIPDGWQGDAGTPQIPDGGYPPPNGMSAM